jgi:hypothetical protein
VLSRAEPDPSIDLARLSIPFEWFPPDSLVSEAFHMHPLVPLPLIPILFLEVHHNFSMPARRWDAPYSVITPREQPLSFAAGSQSLEFITIPSKRTAEIDGVAADFGSRESEW